MTAAAWLLAVSPFFVYYGRDLIPETWLAVLTLALVAAGSLYLESRRREHLTRMSARAGWRMRPTAAGTTRSPVASTR